MAVNENASQVADTASRRGIGLQTSPLVGSDEKKAAGPDRADSLHSSTQKEIDVATISDPLSAQRALLAMYAEDMYNPAEADALNPPLDPRASDSWRIVGYLTAANALFSAQTIQLGERVYFGFLANSIATPSQYVAVVRGTESAIEWLENLEGLLVPHPLAGQVEQGFFSIYQSLRYSAAGAGTLARAQAEGDTAGAVGIAAALPPNASLTVIGHSLGSALGTYLLCDLAQIAPRQFSLDACLIASPHAGDRTFVERVDHDAPLYKVYNYIFDIVPHVPPSLPLGFGFQPLPKATWITSNDAQARINNDLLCNHHAFCYAAMLDYASVAGVVNPYSKCILRKAG